MKSLRLPLKNKWFQMTKAGTKTEDYREITPYWLVRLFYLREGPLEMEFCLYQFCEELKYSETEAAYLVKYNNLKTKEFEANTLTLGYPKSTDNERIIKFEHAGIEIKRGNIDWGADPGKLYFVIKHGKRLM